MKPIYPKSKSGQHWKLLVALLRGERFTPVSAVQKLGIWALSQRCGDLRRLGWPIASEWRRHEGGRHCEYFIPAEARRRLEVRKAA